MVNKKNILVTGSNGQLGSSLIKFSIGYPFNFFFKSKADLNISNKEALCDFVSKNEIKYLINCAAFTDVDESERNFNKAELVNSISVGYLAEICLRQNIKLIHISTDYVFSGSTKLAYIETNKTVPVNNYGVSKLKGEQNILKSNLKNSIIIRTSWLYSEFSNNFVTKIISKIKNKKKIHIYSNEIGSPTNANDLAKAILEIIPKINNDKTQVYHYSNGGYCSRYEFAKKINQLVHPKNFIFTKFEIDKSYTTRPEFSALNCYKISNDFDLEIISWDISLENFFYNLQ